MYGLLRVDIKKYKQKLRKISRMILKEKGESETRNEKPKWKTV